jgi:hypothetical protein
MKFEIDLLVLEMLDQLPETVWFSNSTTFLDPAIGGGQFVRAIEQRLREYGHSDSNIQKRVVGFEESDLHIRYAVNKHKLVGQYVRKPYNKFLEMDENMKFDAIIGNPPYQDKNQILWRDFVKKSISLTKKDGYLTLVTPNSWASGAKNNLYNDLFQKKDTQYINMNGSQFFPHVGKDIGFWLLKNSPVSKKDTTIYDDKGNPQLVDLSRYPFFIRKFNLITLSIFEKVQLSKSFWSEFVERKPKFSREFAFPKIKYNGGYKYGYRYDGVDYNYPSSPVVLSLDMSNYSASQVKNLYDLFASPFYRFLWDIYGAADAGSFGWILRNMPKLDLNKTWTDQEIYNHFGLTQGEIIYIKNAIK